MEQTHIAEHSAHNEGKNWYDKSYRWMLIPPLILIIFSIAFMYNFYQREGDIIYKDVSLTGGTTLSVFDSSADIAKVRESLRKDFPDVNVREISDIQTGGQRGFSVETKAGVDEIKKAVEDILDYKLTSDNSSVEFSGSTLSAGFYQQLRNSLIAAFLLMSFVVFAIFGESKKIKGIALILTSLGVKLMLPSVGLIVALCTMSLIAGFLYAILSLPRNRDWNVGIIILSVVIAFMFFAYLKFWLILPVGVALIGIYAYYSVPSLAVISCAFIDILMTLIVVNYLGIVLSTAGIIAFMMLIGYSVDTDILMTTRLLKKKEGSVDERLYGAFKTGLTMSLTSIAAVGVSLFIIKDYSETLKQIFTIILIGIGFDIFNTWVTNASLLKWYMEVKKLS